MEEQATTTNKSGFKQAFDDVQLWRWLIIWFAICLIPLVLLTALWLIFNPDIKIIAIITVLYIGITFALLIPLFRENRG